MDEQIFTPKKSFKLPFFLLLTLVILAGGYFAYGYNQNFWPFELEKKEEACIQVITSARDPKTGRQGLFPTPCDVPNGWEIIQQNTLDESSLTAPPTSTPFSQTDSSNWTLYEDEERGFEIKYSPNSNKDFAQGIDFETNNRYFGVNGVGSAYPPFYFSIYVLPLRSTNGVPCSESAGGYYRNSRNEGTIMISGTAYPKCLIDRELQGDQALHISFNKNGKTWLFQATNYDRDGTLIDTMLSTFKFTK